MRRAPSPRRGRSRRARRALAAAAWLAAIAIAGPALATPEVPLITASVVPALGTGSSLPWGWHQVLVRVHNAGSQPAKGSIDVRCERYVERQTFHATAPYSVGAGATVHVRVPVRVSAYGDVQVRVLDEAGEQVAHESLSSSTQSVVMLLDVSETSRLRAVLHETSIAPLYAMSGRASMGTSAGPATLSIGQPQFDPATGDPLLPDRPPLYSAADAVLMRTDTLSRLTGAALDALAGYVLAGGTLALTVSRPEDMRHPTLVALVGGEVTKARVAAETLREVPPPASAGMGRTLPSAPNAGDALATELSGWSGGNLRGSPYGSSSTYGLGEVHLLAFDPTRKPAIDDPWALLRVVDLARRAHDRRATVVFRPGDEMVGLDMDEVRRELDPNESGRWSIALSAILLCIYAVIAGPVNFSLAARRGRPLRALRRLPVYAAVTFAVVVGIGMFAKGVSGRARHLTLVEAGAGMTKATARRFRGFFASRSRELTVRTSDASSMVSTAVLAELSERRDNLVIDRDGARLVDVAALPWQTVVVREDGFASMGEGIDILPEPAGAASVVNRTGRDLRAALLWLPSGEARYFARIKDGERVSSAAGDDLSAEPRARTWLSSAGTGRRVGGMDVHALRGNLLQPILDRDAPGLGDAWAAIEEAASDSADWLPSGVPVLLGQLDGGEGRASDSGLRLESDRLLVRVVGYGGRP